jgi:hypothetical protein
MFEGRWGPCRQRSAWTNFKEKKKKMKASFEVSRTREAALINLPSLRAGVPAKAENPNPSNLIRIIPA